MMCLTGGSLRTLLLVFRILNCRPLFGCCATGCSERLEAGLGRWRELCFRAGSSMRAVLQIFRFTVTCVGFLTLRVLLVLPTMSRFSPLRPEWRGGILWNGVYPRVSSLSDERFARRFPSSCSEACS
jgi:hypothetical protein